MYKKAVRVLSPEEQRSERMTSTRTGLDGGFDVRHPMPEIQLLQVVHDQFEARSRTPSDAASAITLEDVNDSRHGGGETSHHLV